MIWQNLNPFRYVRHNCMLRFDGGAHVPSTLSLPPTFVESIVSRLGVAYDVVMSGERELTVIGGARDIACVDMALARFCRVSK